MAADNARAMNIPDKLEEQIWKVQLGCVVVVVVLAIGLWANLPYLTAEHQRLEPWKIAGLWAGDVMGLLWFLLFAFEHAVLREPLAPVAVNNGRRQLRLLVLAGAAALLIDLSMTLYLMYDERAGYARSQITEAQVVAVEVHKRSLATGYDLDCTFKDKFGAPHTAHTRVLAKHHVLPAPLSPETALALTAPGEGHRVIRIRYDPRLPERAWIDGLGWEDENGMYWFSVGVLCLQAWATAVFLLLMRRHSTGNVWPWWGDVYKVLPLAAETFCMLMMGLIDRLMDSLP